MSDRQRHGFVLLLVIGLIAASAIVIATKTTFLGLDLKGGVELVYQAEATPQSPVNQSSLNRAVDIMRQRVDQLGVSEPEIQTYGGNQISVGLPDVQDVSRAEEEVGSTARLYFYDWEANVLTPNGRTVAGQLTAQDPTAVTISQGGGLGPGLPGGGGTTLYQAVQLASKQPVAPASTTQSHAGPVYYVFGAPGSAACAAAAKADKTTPIQGEHCLLAGPETSAADLQQDLPVGVTLAQGQRLAVPRGTVVLQAANPSATDQVKPDSPSAQFFVLKDHIALTGSDITNPQQSTDSGGNPDVEFGFNAKGEKAFETVTDQIAHRGAITSPAGSQQNQHFAVALGGAGLNTQLITVPQIDFKMYPDGITGGGGADITGGFTTSSAQDLATQLRLGALPINLKLISEETVSATLGKQALHQGLIAGIIGLGVVILFLLAYYRVLGLIATSALIVYGLYFYALIKLIPITMTLAGIAGLILTIGVAADANIVIFERVKEEIRAGRSVRQGIIIGYRKGLTAIIDANVVTIMTAFVLFVLATADVKGFAFTLGIGTIVSLFTAVLATQAILMTMGDSRAISSPSALGAGGRKHVWRYDFMGASKYFFSLSGCILLIGALAIGGRGLNLGIDFTSGARATFGLQHAATQSQVTSALEAAGVSDPTVQKVSGDKALGPYGFQVSSKKLPAGGRAKLQNTLQQKFGLAKNGTDFNYTSVGPTFGKTVAHSAVVAIIASLLIISVYITLRFDWKFSVPVLIALMHDLLITAGVYALLGREVTVDTVAALLTILGYSLYDTIIVFDRVRENIPRMPRAAFSQVVNRSMSEVLTRSIATTSCTLLPIIALLAFGGGTLRDFAFALLVGVASGAYSSIFIASPVLTHWKEREPTYRHRRARILADHGVVAPYAASGADIEPARGRGRGRAGRLTEPDPENVSAAEFEQMKRDLDIEREPTRRTSTLSKRLAHTDDGDDAGAKTAGRNAGATPGGGDAGGTPGGAGTGRSPRPPRQPRAGRTRKAPAAPEAQPPTPAPPASPAPAAAETPGNGDLQEGFTPAPDEAENDGMMPAQKPSRPGKARSRNRRHGRSR